MTIHTHPLGALRDMIPELEHAIELLEDENWEEALDQLSTQSGNIPAIIKLLEDRTPKPTIPLQHLIDHLEECTGQDILSLQEEATWDGRAAAICVRCATVLDEPLEPDAADVPCCEVCDDGGAVSSVLIITDLI